jgi:hypothetical protein
MASCPHHLVFETFVLKPFLADYTPFHPRFESLFNSYYNSIGEQHPANLSIHQLARPADDNRATVISGLSRQQKQLPPKYFYDQTGSELFDRITDTEPAGSPEPAYRFEL